MHIVFPHRRTVPLIRDCREQFCELKVTHNAIRQVFQNEEI